MLRQSLFCFDGATGELINGELVIEWLYGRKNMYTFAMLGWIRVLIYLV